ncbi:MAG TPA: cytidine deaminase [Terriglobales bacterium]|nr:cytidine deaminase [Terriglobales bacterium]
MHSRSADNGISRRAALTRLGASALGLSFMNSSLFDQRATAEALGPPLSKFSERSRTLLSQTVEDPEFSGRIPADLVDAVAKSEKASVDDVMLRLLPLAQSYSRAPISNFFVGVVVRGASGSLYLGANVEIPGQCLGFAVHAEQAALSNAYMNSEESVTTLAVVGGAPCGHCRQFMEEISPAGEIRVLIPNRPPVKLASILPMAFGPTALGATQGALPIRKTNLVFTGKASDVLSAAALNAACRSYAPYSKSPAGVAIRTTAGRIFQGCYIENVAFNPSLSPLQTALVQLILAGQPYSSIAAVTLVEVQRAKISQRAVTETVLGALAPQLKLEVVLARV